MGDLLPVHRQRPNARALGKYGLDLERVVHIFVSFWVVSLRLLFDVGMYASNCGLLGPVAPEIPRTSEI